MINVSKEDGKIKVGCGEALGYELIAEAIAACASVVQVVSTPQDEDKVDEVLSREAFKLIVVGVAQEFLNRYDIDILGDCDDDGDDEDDDDDDDSDDGHVIVKALPADSDTAKKILELLGIDPDEAKPKDDETEDDLPDFLF